MPEKPAALLLFPDDWAGFSPTLTRLSSALDRHFRPRAVVFDTGRYSVQGLDPRIFTSIVVPRRLATVLRKTGCYGIVRIVLLARAARAHRAADPLVIAVDAHGAIAAFLAGLRFHVLSLEIGGGGVGEYLVRRRAESVAIQSVERAQALLGPDPRARVFYLQNAPGLGSIHLAPPRSAPADAVHPRLVYMGNLLPDHGLHEMIGMARAWEGASLTLCGPIRASEKQKLLAQYRELFENGRVVLREGFVEDAEVVPFLRGFDIGLCLYTLQGRKARDVNYITSPSGKMFNYFAAGLPVLASGHSGLNPVTRFSAGIQVASCSASALVAAGKGLLASYALHSQGALAAARASDFDVGCASYLDYLRDWQASR